MRELVDDRVDIVDGRLQNTRTYHEYTFSVEIKNNKKCYPHMKIIEEILASGQKSLSETNHLGQVVNVTKFLQFCENKTLNFTKLKSTEK